MIVSMASFCFRVPITAVPTNEQLLREKKTCAKFQIDISKTEVLARVYTDKKLREILIYAVQGIKSEFRTAQP